MVLLLDVLRQLVVLLLDVLQPVELLPALAQPAAAAAAAAAAVRLSLPLSR